MSKAVINAIALALPLATVYYWFELREPADTDAAPQASAPLVSKHSKADERSCLRRIDAQSVEMRVRADCELAKDGPATDTLGQVTEDLQGQLVVTGYDL